MQGDLLLRIDILPIGNDIVYSRPESHNCHRSHRDIGKDMVLAEYLYPSEKHGLKEDHGNADHLCGGLDLAELAWRNNDSVASRDDESERRYRKLTEHDDRRSPKKRGADIGKSGHGSVIADKNPEKRGKYDELIREGIHELAEIRY